MESGMKIPIFLLSLVYILILTNYNSEWTEMVHAQKILNPISETILKNKPVNYYSIEEVRERLSNPSSHYKNSSKFPELKAGK